MEQLTKDFLLNFVEGQLPVDIEPILQITEIRKIENDNARGCSYRIRVSDGEMSYSTAGFANTVCDQVAADGIEDSTKKSVIRVTEFKRMEAIPDKPSFTIFAYELLRKLDHVIGNPIQYKNKDSFAGLREAKQRQRENMQPTSMPIPPNRKRPAADPNTYAAMSTQGQNITPIKMISPFINKWRICGVVKGKENVREIKGARGPSKVFSFQVMDTAGDLIKVACFGDQADRFNAIIHNDQCFYISGAGGASSIRPANKRFNSTGHDYELVLNKDSEVHLSQDKIKSVAMQYNFKPLSKICEFSGETIDVLAIIEKVEEPTKVNTKAGKEMSRKKIHLVDESGTIVELTLWDTQCDEYDMHLEGNLIAIKGAFVREFNGSYSLGLSSGSIVDFDLDHDRAIELRRWYENERPTAEIKSMSSSDSFGQSLERDLRFVGIASSAMLGKHAPNGDYFNIVAIVTSIKGDTAIYKACVTDNCRKKLVQMDNNQYRCEKCDVTTPNYKHAIILALELSDLSGSNWATMFEETATKILNRSAQELGRLQEEDLDEYNKIFESIRFKAFNCRIRAKSQFFNDQEQIKWSVYDMKPVPYDMYNRYLKKTIKSFEDSSLDADDF
uniref:Replication protein A subunit n=1 Tax=Acrobeloides nanus TaxID=290746 RepID=A0A914BYU2_9BILA